MSFLDEVRQLVESSGSEEETEEEKAIDRKQDRLVARMANRVQYLPEVVLSRYMQPNGSRRWIADFSFRCQSLMKLAVETKFGPQDQPVAVQILNKLPGVGREKEPIDEAAWEATARVNLDVSGYRLGWNVDSPACPWLQNLFPNAVDFRAYNHSLNTPVWPGGSIETDVVLKLLKKHGKPLGSDGSGRIHPNHPLFRQLNRPGGACVVQFRFINDQGTFAKGILVPDESCGTAVNPQIWLDWNQIKGRNKKQAEIFRHADKERKIHGFLGVINLWDRPNSIGWCFENLEWIKVTPDTISLIKKFVDKAFDELVEQGVESLLRGVPDQQAQAILALLKAAKQAGMDIEPIQVPAICSLLKQRLGKRLWQIATGAGKRSQLAVPVMDSCVPEGRVVIAGFKPGTKLAIFRIPLVLAQGLMVLETTHPFQHQRINGRVLRHAIFMNPKDLVLRAQGDDDGDIVGVSDDPDVIELHESRLNDGLFQIEPEGVAFELPSSSEEGKVYIRGKPRGPVGLCTVFRSQLLAAGDRWGAISMALMTQEATDCAKKRINWSNWEAAAIPENWEEKDGTLSFSVRRGGGSEFPQQDISRWVSRRLREHGIQFGQTTIGWNALRSSINPDFWPDTKELGGCRHGNLVHVCFDYARQKWQEVKHKLLPEKPDVEIVDLLDRLLIQKGVPPIEHLPTWEEYRSLRDRSGLRRFGQSLAQMRDLDSEARIPMLDDAKADLHASLQELVAGDTPTEQCRPFQIIWRMETSGSIDPNRLDNPNPNHAFRAVLWPGSPVAQLLGVQEPTCGFLNNKSIARIVEHCLEHADPFRRLADIVFSSTHHGRKMRDENGEPIEGWQCKHCRDMLQNALIRKIRHDRTRGERRFVASLVSRLNKLTPEESGQKAPPTNCVPESLNLEELNTIFPGDQHDASGWADSNSPV